MSREARCPASRGSSIANNLLISIKKTAAPTRANAAQLSAELAAVVSGRVNAQNPWTFYEQLDQFLGPWGAAGYPLAYGRFYCQLFNTDPALQNNAEARTWVQKTTMKLQELLRHAVVDLFLKGKLATMTEPALKALAFHLHPQAFDENGLALIVLVAPHLAPAVGSIPAMPFTPLHPNSRTAWLQVLDTMRLLSSPPPMRLPPPAPPTRHGSIQRTEATSSMHALLAAQRQNAWYRAHFAKIREALQSQRLNRVAWLDDVTNRLQTMPLSDPYWRQVARDLAVQADAQKGAVANAYSSMLQIHPELRAKIDELDPPWAYYLLQPDVCAQ